MNILQILPELNVGGVETGTVDFAKYLVEHRHHSIVVSHGGQLTAGLKKGGSKHYTLPVHKKSLRTMWKMVEPLRAIIRKENIDIVHARSRVPAWIAYFACQKTKAIFITTCHGRYNNRLFSQVMGWSKLVIVPSRAIGRYMIDRYKVPSDRIRCIARSVDLTKFENISKKTNSRVPVIAIVGRLTPIKGHRHFLKAMAKVIRQKPKIKIQIVGDASPDKEDYKQELHVLVRRLGLKDHVTFLGNRKDVPKVLSKVDVLVMASTIPESFGRVILEAQAVGVPVVATRVGGVVDIIDEEKTGLMVMPKDSDAMAAAVLRILNNENFARQLTEAATIKLHKNFTLDHMACRTLKVYEEIQNLVNILVIKISSMGDVVLITASLRAIRKKFPEAKIYCLVGKESRKILRKCPYLEGLIVVDLKYKDKGWLKLLKLSGQLRRYRFDKIIDFQNNRKSHLLSFLSVPKESYGYDNGKWGGFLTHPLRKYKNDIPPVEHQFQLLNQLGIPHEPNARLELWPSNEDREYVDNLLDSEWLGNSKNIIGINIAASEKWQTKNWPVEHIARLCDILAEWNIRVIITGMEKDKPLAQKLMSLTKAKPAIFVGKTDLLQLAALIQRCKVFITPDSAPMHVAAAMKTPFIAFFGPTDSKRHAPPSKNKIILNKKLTCTPCYKPHCKILTHACLKEITPEEVMEKIENIVQHQ